MVFELGRNTQKQKHYFTLKITFILESQIAQFTM